MATAYYVYIRIHNDNMPEEGKPLQFTKISDPKDVGEGWDGSTSGFGGKWVWLGLVVYDSTILPSIRTDPVEFKEMLERIWDNLDNSK